MTSRMFSSPARIATKRSMPTAKPACGGAPKRNASSRNPNRSCASSGVDAEHREDALLDVGPVDSHRARAELPAVEHEVVGLRPHRQRVGFQRVEIVGVRHRERMVHGDDAARLVVEPPRTAGSRRPTRSAAPRRSADGPGRAEAGRAPTAPSAGRPRRAATGRRAARPARRRGRAARPPTGTSRSATRARRRVAHAHPHETRRAERLGALGQRVEAATAPRSPWPGTRMPFTASAPANALKSVAPKTSPRSTSSMPKRTSGLSTP